MTSREKVDKSISRLVIELAGIYSPQNQNNAIIRFKQSLCEILREEVKNTAKPQLLREGQVEEGLAWCDGRNKLREELDKLLQQTMGVEYNENSKRKGG